MAKRISKNGKAIIKADLKSSPSPILARKNGWVYFSNGFYVIRMFDLTFTTEFAKIIGFDGELYDGQYYRYMTENKMWGHTDSDGKWIEMGDAAIDKAYLSAYLLPWTKSENINAPQCRFFYSNSEQIGLLFSMFDENYCDIMDGAVKYLFPKGAYSMLVARTYLGEGVAVMPVKMTARTRKTVEYLINEHLAPNVEYDDWEESENA